MSALGLDGRVAVVTGAAGGMGSAITARLAAAGARVVAGDLAVEAGEAVVDDVRAGGGEAVFRRVDVADAADVAGLVATAVERFGGLDCAVNAAAVEFEQAPLADCEDADFDRMMAVNARSVFLCMKHEIRAMLAGGRGGSIVNIASTNAVKPQPGQPAYTASKHAVLGLTRSAALDYAREGIRINAICPGAIDTPMLRSAMARRGVDVEATSRRLSILRRIGRPDEVAEAALWLCSDASSFTTGHALAVDGGMLTA